jgi:hypothetical protein
MEDETNENLNKVMILLNEIISMMLENDVLLEAIKKRVAFAPQRGDSGALPPQRGESGALPQNVRRIIKTMLITKYLLMKYLKQNIVDAVMEGEITKLLNPNETDVFQQKLRGEFIEEYNNNTASDISFLEEFCRLQTIGSGLTGLKADAPLITEILKKKESICTFLYGRKDSIEKGIFSLLKEIKDLQSDLNTFLENITKDDLRKLSQEFEAFNRFYNNILIKFRIPYPESTNPKLQTLFDLTSTDKIRGLFKLLNVVNRRYFLLELNAPKISAELLYTGFSRINVTSYQDVPKYEIYVLVDLIGGIVDKNNRSAIKCKFDSEQLAFETRVATEKSKQREDEKTPWLLDLDRLFFSVKGSPQQYGIDSFDVEVQPVTLLEKDNRQPNQPIQPIQPNQPKPFTQPLNIPREETKKKFDENLFLQRVIRDKSIADKIRKSNEDTEYDKTINLLPDATFIAFMEKTEPEFFAIIKNWDINAFERNEKLINKMIEYQSRFTGIINQKKESLSRADININKKRKLNHDIIIYNLFIAVVEKMLSIEKAKTYVRQGAYGGTIKNKRGKYNRRNRTKKIKILYE